MKTLALILALAAQCPPGAGSCPSPRGAVAPSVQRAAAPAAWVPREAARRSVRLEIRAPGSTYQGSGTVVSVAGGRGLVLTCRHLFRGAAGAPIAITKGSWSAAGELVATDDAADLAAVAFAAPGAADWSIDLAAAQPDEGVMVGYALGRRVGQAWMGRIRPGRLGSSVLYSFPPEEGDSGGGVFDRSGRLAGVVWGKTPDGAVVPVAAVRRFLGLPALALFDHSGDKLKAKAKHGSTVTIGDAAPAPAAVPGPAGPPGPQGPPGAPANVDALLQRITALERRVDQPITFVTPNPDGTQSAVPVKLGQSIGFKIPQSVK